MARSISYETLPPFSSPRNESARLCNRASRSMLVAEAEVTPARVRLNFTLLLVSTVSKLLPSIVTAVPAGPIVGVKPVIAGAPEVLAPTVKEVLLVAEPLGEVTAIGPVVAGRVASVTSPLGEVARFEYANSNFPTQGTDPANGVSALTHDANGNVLSVSDARSNSSSYGRPCFRSVRTRDAISDNAHPGRTDFRRLCEGDRTMIKTFSDLPGWSFEIEEVSNGVYEVIGSDQEGHRVQAKGTDVDTLLQECYASAQRIYPPSRANNS